MKKILLSFIFTFILIAGLSVGAAAQTVTESSLQAPEVYTVQPGDSMWFISVRYEVGLSELIQANPSIKNPAMIYPKQKITIPVIAAKNYEKEVVRLVNIERAKAGLSALKENWEMSRVSRIKCQDMINKRYFDHNSPTYGSPFDMMKSFGITYRAAGENIAKGQKTPSSVVTAWMKSTGHRKNILSPSYNEIGVGYAKDSSGMTYWGQLFRQK